MSRLFDKMYTSYSAFLMVELRDEIIGSLDTTMGQSSYSRCSYMTQHKSYNEKLVICHSRNYFIKLLGLTEGT